MNEREQIHPSYQSEFERTMKYHSQCTRALHQAGRQQFTVLILAGLGCACWLLMPNQWQGLAGAALFGIGAVLYAVRIFLEYRHAVQDARRKYLDDRPE